MEKIHDKRHKGSRVEPYIYCYSALICVYIYTSLLTDSGNGLIKYDIITCDDEDNTIKGVDSLRYVSIILQRML
jgi:hypothetical protein